MAFKKRNGIWDRARRADLFSKAVHEIGVEAVNDIHENIDQSIPGGITYRRGSIKRKASAANNVPGLRRAKDGRRIVGSKFHKASAKGQPPAKDTKRLYNSTKSRRISAYRVRVYNDAPYAKHLEPPADLDRPFLKSVVKKNLPKYREIAERRKRELIGGTN